MNDNDKCLVYSNGRKMKYSYRKLPAGRANHLTRRRTSMLFLLERRKGSGKYSNEWLLEENQDSLVVEGPQSQFGTLSTNVKASGLEGERAVYSFVQNLKRLELCLSNVGYHISEIQQNIQFEA